ncbi:MAG TPA: heterodisulfide reductase-related iron-sulfur binding cluster, partial [Gemmatimonadales bacterium]
CRRRGVPYKGIALAMTAILAGDIQITYARLLRDDPQYAERAASFSRKCRDVSELLAELEPRAERHTLALRAAYHDACHLQHAQHIRAEPRRLLRSIPHLEVLEVPDSALCCGSAGIFNLTEPEAARELGRRKVQNCLATGADVILSGNPGCLLQIAAGLARAGRSVPVLHTIQALDASIRGVLPEGVGSGSRLGACGVRSLP